MKKYQVLPHKADLAIKGFGKNPDELFINLAEGLFYLVAKGDVIREVRRVKINVKGEDNESLLVNFLNELLYRSEIEHLTFAKIGEIKISDGSLSAIAHGTPLLERKIDVKAATFHDVKIERVDDHLEVVVLFDI